MIIKIFLKNHDYSLKQKIINFSIILLIFIFITIQVWFKNNSSDPKYLKIRDFEDSISTSFMGRFFENKVSDMIKFRDLIIEIYYLIIEISLKVKIRMFQL